MFLSFVLILSSSSSFHSLGLMQPPLPLSTSLLVLVVLLATGWLSTAEGAIIYLGQQNATDDPACGTSKQSPCFSLAYIISSLAKSGDSIVVLEDSSPYLIKDSIEIIQPGLTIIGEGMCFSIDQSSERWSNSNDYPKGSDVTFRPSYQGMSGFLSLAATAYPFILSSLNFEKGSNWITGHPPLSERASLILSDLTFRGVFSDSDSVIDFSEESNTVLEISISAIRILNCNVQWFFDLDSSSISLSGVHVSDSGFEYLIFLDSPSSDSRLCFLSSTWFCVVMFD